MYYGPLVVCSGMFYYFLFSRRILSRVLLLTALPYVCSFLVREETELLEAVSRLVCSYTGVVRHEYPTLAGEKYQK